MARFERKTNQRRYKKLFVVAAEGRNTESQYFGFLGRKNSVVRVHCIKHGDKSSPVYLLKAIEKYLKEIGLRDTDEAWCVCDTDKWTPEQLRGLLKWSKKKTNYGLAVSNPNFEFWLLLHFENGGRVNNPDDCKARLKRHLPGYDKNINFTQFPEEKIREAVARAKMRDNPPCGSLPGEKQTTVYRLVENILAVS